MCACWNGTRKQLRGEEVRRAAFQPSTISDQIVKPSGERAEPICPLAFSSLIGASPQLAGKRQPAAHLCLFDSGRVRPVVICISDSIAASKHRWDANIGPISGGRLVEYE